MFKLNEQEQKNKLLSKEKVALVFFVTIGVFVTLFKYAWYVVQEYLSVNGTPPETLWDLFFIG